MAKKIIIPLFGDEVAPRFDLATEVCVIEQGPGGEVLEERSLVLPQASAEQLCHLIITEGIHAVICGGIEEEYYQFLTWKRVEVVDAVIGPWRRAAERYLEGILRPGDVVL